jgi:hypothetical protein
MSTFAGCALTLRTDEIQDNLNSAKAILSHKADPDEWEGYEEALILFSTYMGLEYRFRGNPKKAYTFYNGKLANMRLKRSPYKRTTRLPHWLGYDAVHEEHRRALIKMDPDWYIAKFREVRVYG